MPKLRERNATTPDSPLSRRVAALGKILGMLAPIPDSWLGGASEGKKKGMAKGMECIPCESYAELRVAWEKALEWTPGLDHALVSMLASISSVKCVGDQLWLKVIGPASCGKSVLCEALTVNKEYILAKSSVRGFHSGYVADGGTEGEDNSLVSELFNMTLVTKDGDTILQAPNLAQILSEARDIYDGTSRTHYRNKMGKDYEGLRMTWLLCGTSSLRSIDQSELGERFLDVVIMEGIDEDLEEIVLRKVADRTERNLSIEAGDDPTTHHEPDMAYAMQLTGGYITYLRENASELITKIYTPDNVKTACMRLGKFVALMRARPSYLQEETAEREFAARLVSQHMRMAKCTALVLNEKTINSKVMQRISKVAVDTGRGQTLNIAKALYEEGSSGLSVASVAARTFKTKSKTDTLLRFLAKISVIEQFNSTTQKGLPPKYRWRLTENMEKLYAIVDDLGQEL
jgi:hypothetical protein